MILKNRNVFGCLIISFTAFALTQTISVLDPAFGQTSEFTPASTRGFFNLTTGDGPLPITNLPNISEILDLENRGCPGEISFYVHGVWANETQAREQGERVFLSLNDSDYDIPVIGYSWDSNTSFSLTDPNVALDGWSIAKKIANGNGQLLAQLILDFKEACEGDNVRIIAHSLGGRLTLAALQSIHVDPEWTNDLNHQIKSVHLLGAAVDNEQISTRPSDCSSNSSPISCSGEAIGAVVERFYNLYNPEDNMLQYVYNSVEGNEALGWCGEEGGSQWFATWWCFIGNSVTEPENYIEYSVISELPPYQDSNIDGECDVRNPDGSCSITRAGDNHLGYLGYRDSPTSIFNNGAMDKIATDWKEQQ
jgi:Alpha/beta hydrolase of unknown function (DUF900)